MMFPFESAHLEGKKQILNISFAKEEHVLLSRCHPSFASTVTKTNAGTFFLGVSRGEIKDSQISKHEKSSVSKVARHYSVVMSRMFVTVNKK